MTIFSTTDNEVSEALSDQEFKGKLDPKMSLEKYKHVAFIFSVLQNSTAVLTDLKSKEKYVYHGGLSLYFGLAEKKTIPFRAQLKPTIFCPLSILTILKQGTLWSSNYFIF